ncbi:hypothetical protein Smp_071210 [Schistosoma mansoni]|uniref:hypothetical protein n=1 Tax=Schistosoma mansoni TaxID=6183 RepID=UPI0001A62A9E|nr:hypothetical protein Smp_071210 [Schistosoma mansoni]|eukprot:XP_018651418.1 hypothetical protein Smp_071210 [Schistosoma mansoni]
MSCLSLPYGKRIQRLFQGETLGDSPLSQFLCLLQVPVGDNTMSEVVLIQGKTQSLTCYVQPHLNALDPDTSLSHLARTGNRIMKRGPQPAHARCIIHKKENNQKIQSQQSSLRVLKFSQRRPLKCKWVIETEADCHNDQDLSYGAGNERPNNLDRSVGITESLVPIQSDSVSHVPGPHRLLRITPTHIATSGSGT